MDAMDYVKPPTQENSTATLIGYIYEIYADFFEENLLSFENSRFEASNFSIQPVPCLSVGDGGGGGQIIF